SIEGKLEGRPSNLVADAKLALGGFALELPEASIDGEGSTTLKLRTEGNARRGQLHADFTAMRLRYGDELHKPKGAALEVDATLEGDQEVSQARLLATLSSLKVGDLRLTST